LIIVRSPLRISLGGGGTDLPSAYEKIGRGFWISAAIDKYVYVTITRPFEEGIYLKYSDIEKVKTVDEVKHPIIREALRLLELKTPQIEITTLADIPAKTGLGSSGSFECALLKGLWTHYQKILPPKELADLACRLEIDILKTPSGLQDQYISSFGGINKHIVDHTGNVSVQPLNIQIDTMRKLEENLLLFFTGFSRSAGDILKDQDAKTKQGDSDMIENLTKTLEIGYQSAEFLESGNLEGYAYLMLEHWMNKRKRSGGMSNPQIDEWCSLGMKNGALGMKLVGAGSGGFLMFYANDKEKLRRAMKLAGLQEVRFGFDYLGTRVL
jgi:D-glycero-alpha-D-manno-heptose-7-phosphate kinase